MAGKSAWASGLFDCFADCESCATGYAAPFVTYAQNAQMLDGGQTEFTQPCMTYAVINMLCPIAVSCFTFGNRTRLREKYGLEEDMCPDCLAHFCCLQCALCQENRELKHRLTQARPDGIRMRPVYDSPPSAPGGNFSGGAVPPPQSLPVFPSHGVPPASPYGPPQQQPKGGPYGPPAPYGAPPYGAPAHNVPSGPPFGYQGNFGGGMPSMGPPQRQQM